MIVEVGESQLWAAFKKNYYDKTGSNDRRVKKKIILESKRQTDKERQRGTEKERDRERDRERGGEIYWEKGREGETLVLEVPLLLNLLFE